MRRRSHRRARLRSVSFGLAALFAISTLQFTPAGRATTPSSSDPEYQPTAEPPSADAPASIPENERGEILGAHWEKSTDRAFLTSGDGNGFHVLIADADEGFRWRRIASLSEPGFSVDSWIGNACVTGSGRRAVVAYAPRTFTNDPKLMQRGAFTATVDLTDGTVTKLPVQTSLAYFNPGCGTGEEVILTQGGDEDLGRTRLLRLDTESGKITSRIEVEGQLTSPVPTEHGIVAADSGGLVRVDDDGTRRIFASATGVPFRVAADSDDGVVFMERTGKEQARVRRAVVAPVKDTSRATSVTTLATGELMSVNVTSGKGGRVFVTGETTRVARSLPSSVALVDVSVRARMSMRGSLAVTSVAKARAPRPGEADVTAAVVDGARPQPLAVEATVLATGKSVEFSVTTADAEFGEQGPTAGRAPSPALGSGKPRTMSDPHNPADFDERYCSVPRSDPRNQAMQPKPRQVEWAVDQAVRNALDVYRPANWKNLGMPAYTPQGLFPYVELSGGGYVPAQVMLGVAAQESNLWQAARSAVPGVTGNPLIGNYYGIDYYNDTEADDWTINWAEADCGYGVTQVTDGMRLAGKERPGEVAMDYDKQRAVALDFAANIAAGLQILATKWNETREAGMIVNNGDPSKIENWFFAVWAYNSGFHPDKGDGSPWGVGWLNNPVNPIYPANRAPFLEFTYEDAAHPQDWPYPEKVMGWAGHPVEVLEAPGELVAGFRPAWWNGGTSEGAFNRQRVKPPVTQFCDASNDCVPGEQFLPDDPEVIGEPAGPCSHRNASGYYDLQCWYHEPSTWKEDCDYSCGNELLRFDPGYEYQEDATSYPPRCDLSGLPSNALIVDDVPDDVPSIRPDCPRSWSNAGTFEFTFKQDSDGTYPGKIDVHQIGGGFGGHFWFTHTRTATDEGGRLEVNASWKLDRSHTGPMSIYVALPDHGAHTNYARYVVKTAHGDRVRIVRQPGEGNRWVRIGAFPFDGVPEVTLTSVTPDGTGEEDIAFDAVAFVPINGTYHEESVEAVAVFDEDQDIDTAAPESWLGGISGTPLVSREALYDWAVATADRILALPTCDIPAAGCLMPRTEQAIREWRDEVITAGTDPVDHPDGTSIARWIGFANSYLDRPSSDRRPDHFDDDGRFKIRTKVTVSFVTDENDKIIPGTEYAVYDHRTGDTHLPRFFLDFVRALAEDYGAWGIGEPNLSYRMRDLNAHNGAWTTANPMEDGVLPGRAYAYAGKAPVLTNYDGEITETGADCVAALTVAGGSIGYRPMLSQEGPTTAMEEFSARLDADDRIAQPLADLVEDVREMFFDDGLFTVVESSLFNVAPPIWQELNLRLCADGSVRKVSGLPLLRSSWMPDQYLYHNGSAIDLDGNYSGSNLPVVKGDFHTFSQTPIHADSPYNRCGPTSGRNGNPWAIAIADPPGANPDGATFCLDVNLPPDPSHSSP
ncbi:golvesin C-terminal-like domain-containing protein [Saccharomonospora glauca]|uniref:Golvesin/Xly CBD-like domain-containing protein n=1 Tax=Saccharomonospora glauca K62 TaxID=928724 RepID=I1D352_9PSEU|nr:hypothetical protein [Saccharomonospora glauca]EIE99376.1 hypothetical protein SacglDRAFT_02483 [Saccharomonospora glauca K62]